jgi:hypothetical protein
MIVGKWAAKASVMMLPDADLTEVNTKNIQIALILNN